MNMTVLAITLIFVGLMEIFGFTAALLLLRKKLEDFRRAGEQFSDNFLRNYAFSRSNEKERDEKQWALLADMAKQTDILKEQYEALDEAYDHMNENYRSICEQYAKLLGACSSAEERYSDCYDQLKYQNERFDRIEKFFVEPQFIKVDVPGPKESSEVLKVGSSCRECPYVNPFMDTCGYPCKEAIIKCDFEKVPDGCPLKQNETNACKWEADEGECTNVVSGAFGQICVANDPADCPYSGMELGDVEQ